MDETATFTWLDYLVFAAMLCVSASIGLYYGCTGSKQNTTSEFLLGSKKMGIFPVGMSLAASFLSASGLMGAPAEMYRYGTMQSINVLTFVVIVPVASYLYAPMFHRLQVASSFEYLERRFSVHVRRLASMILVIQMTLYMATVVWAPALALSQVTGMNGFVAVTVNFVVCAFYTTVGGFKAVLWTDAFQFCMMIISIAIVIVKGSIDVGGPAAVYNASISSNRIEFFEFDTDPTLRHSFWSMIFGGYFMWIAIFGVNQAVVQRYVSMPSKRDVPKALILCFTMIILMDAGIYYLGLVIYTKYKDCDPISAGRVSKIDQLVPLFVMESSSSLPGVPGLFVAGLYSASLSTVSSGLNSLAAVTLEDFVRPILSPNMSDVAATRTSKLLSLFFGLVAYGLVYLMANLNHLVEAVLSIFGLAGGPILGIFTLGMFFPWSNSMGAICGLMSSVGVMFWIGFGAMIMRAQGFITYDRKPVSTEGCTDIFIQNSTVVSYDQSFQPLSIYKLSYMWYSAGGFWLTIISGLIFSGFFGFQDPKTLNPEVVYDLGKKLFWYLPKRAREYLRFQIGDNYFQPKCYDVSSDSSSEEVETSMNVLSKTGRK